MITYVSALGNKHNGQNVYADAIKKGKRQGAVVRSFRGDGALHIIIQRF